MSTPKKIHKVVFLSPGTFFSETSSKEISSWNTYEAMRHCSDISERHGAKPYGFYFETYLTADPISDGQGGKLEISPKLLEKSGTYFINGYPEFYDDVVKRNLDNERILRDNMRINGMWITCITQNSYKHTGHFSNEDFIVNSVGDIIHRGNDSKFSTYRIQKSAQAR